MHLSYEHRLTHGISRELRLGIKVERPTLAYICAFFQKVVDIDQHLEKSVKIYVRLGQLKQARKHPDEKDL